MNCPVCHRPESRVLRSAADAGSIRRHRLCRNCGHTWQTVELDEASLEHDRDIVAKAREFAEAVKDG